MGLPCTSTLDTDKLLQAPRLPVAALLALALAGFITILTEALPAGLLPEISAGLGISQAKAGQMVTVYAIGSLAAAIPLTAATQSLRRRPLLMTAIAGFVIANSITALSDSYVLTLLARFVAGMSAGLLWALSAGYAARMVPEHQKGRAIALAMAGAPLALSLGVPAGTFLGQLMGWRLCFGIMSLLAIVLMAWVRTRVPDFPGRSGGKPLSLGHVFRLAGVRPVLCVVLAFVLAHNVLYTYIAPFLASANMAGSTDRVLLVFGMASLLGIWIIGMQVDRHLRTLTLACAALFGLAAGMLWVTNPSPPLVYAAVAIWGMAFGGIPTLLQTALANAAGHASDIAQSMLVTVWNLAIAAAGLGGGFLLQHAGVGAFSPAALTLLAPALSVIWLARRHGFPAHRRL